MANAVKKAEPIKLTQLSDLVETTALYRPAKARVGSVDRIESHCQMVGA